MYEGYYKENGIEDDLVVVNMADLTGDSLKNIRDIVEACAEDDASYHAVKRIDAYLDKEYHP